MHHKIFSLVFFIIFGLNITSGKMPADEVNLVFNGDFEIASTSNPPPGWAMWGAHQYHVPANFTRDVANPHQGKVCLRIHHPAHSDGYVVTSPEKALRPKEGKMYSLSFWARADGAGDAIFGWTAYQQIRPFVDAGSPGFHAIHVDRTWQKYQFTIHEGWDFFAEECSYLMLTFRATGRREQERTLWVDDVVVTESPSTRLGRLMDPKKLAFPPLDHCLKPGEAKVAMTIDAANQVRKTFPEVGGVSFHRVAGWTRRPYDKEGNYVLPQEQEKAIAQLRLPMTRFYAVGDEAFSLETSLDKAAELCRRLGIPQETTVLEFETQGATSKLPPETWAKGVRHSLNKGYGFRHWEITNEPYLGRPGMVFTTPDAFLQHFLAVSRAIRQVHPEASIGMPIHHRSANWGNYLLKQAAGHYDFIVGHYYCFTNVAKDAFEDVVLTANYQMLEEIQKTNAMIRLYNPEKPVLQLDTEWGMHSGGSMGERADNVRRNANIYGMMHRAVRLIHYLREGMLRGASSWEMFTYRKAPGFGLLAADALQYRSMNYWLYHSFNRHFGQAVLEITGTTPYHEGGIVGRKQRGPLTPAVATLCEDGKTLYLMIANGSWQQDLPCAIEVKNFRIGKAESIVLSHANPDGDPFLERPEELIQPLKLDWKETRLQTTLPCHSVVFVKLARD